MVPVDYERAHPYLTERAFAFLYSVLVVTSCGFLSVADLLTPPLEWLSPVMVCRWVVGLLLGVRRYS